MSETNLRTCFSWQVKFDSLVSDHQRSLEDLKASLSRDHPDDRDALELRTTLESLKMEHQLEVENLKAKHQIEAALLIKEREDLCARLQEAGGPTRRPDADTNGTKAALDEASEKLQKAEARLAELEELRVEQDRTSAELRHRLELSEEKMTDYQSLQKAQEESQEEVQKLEEQLRVRANQLQALQADRYSPHDANVSSRGPERSSKSSLHRRNLTALLSSRFFR